MPRRALIDVYRGPLTFGIDVSKWQGSIDWNAVKGDSSGVAFAIIRSGDGSHGDSHAVENLIGANRAGISAGVYHYFRGDISGASQAAIALAVIRDSGVSPFGVAVDIETGADQHGAIETGAVIREALAFLNAIESAGYRAMVYSGSWAHWKLGQTGRGSDLGRFPLWVPSYGATPGAPAMPTDRAGAGAPWGRWRFHQYASNGAVSGIRGNVDMNVWRGGKPAFALWARSGRVGTIIRKRWPYIAAIAILVLVAAFAGLSGVSA